jgi:hypothetical protein
MRVIPDDARPFRAARPAGPFDVCARSLVGLVLGGRPQRREGVSVIASRKRPPDFRQIAKGPEGDASAIIVQRVDCVQRRSKRNVSVWRSRRIGCVWWPGRDDGRILEQAGRIVLRRERRTCRRRGGERENAVSNERVDPSFRGSPLRGHWRETNRRASFCRRQQAARPCGKFPQVGTRPAIRQVVGGRVTAA